MSEPETVRVRFAHGILELPADSAAAILPEDAVLRWRAAAGPPPGATVRLSEVPPGSAVAVGSGGSWDQGVALGRVLRPVGAGRFRVDGDVVDYASREEAEREHGPLVAGDPQPEPAASEGDAIETGDPLTREELARALGCDVTEVEEQMAALTPVIRQRVLARAFAARPDPSVQRPPGPAGPRGSPR